LLVCSFIGTPIVAVKGSEDPLVALELGMDIPARFGVDFVTGGLPRADDPSVVNLVKCARYQTRAFNLHLDRTVGMLQLGKASELLTADTVLTCRQFLCKIR